MTFEGRMVNPAIAEALNPINVRLETSLLEFIFNTKLLTGMPEGAN
jgi:hypothetical protein